MTREQQLRRALQVCLNEMAKGRPGEIYPDDLATWDSAIEKGEAAMRRGYSDRQPSMCPSEE